MIKMSDIVADIEYLPPFSKVAQKAMTIIRNEDFSVRELTDLIKYDPALTANILKVVNSAAYAKSTEINDLQTAISYLGVNQMTSIIMISAARKYFEKFLPGYESIQGEIWEHSLSVATISQELRTYEPNLDSAILFTSALLHDIGKIIMSQYVSDEFEKIITLVQETSIDFTTAERKIIGFTHPVVGSAILKKWNFSKVITDVAKFHHNPDRSNSPYVNIVALSDYISFLIGKMSTRDSLAYSGYEQLLLKYNIKSRELDQIISGSVDKIKDLVDNLTL